VRQSSAAYESGIASYASTDKTYGMSHNVQFPSIQINDLRLELAHNPAMNWRISCFKAGELAHKMLYSEIQIRHPRVQNYLFGF
jgi:hypothetical protein